ncbi:MAG: right-handed parallel beta-helix repeat-containing protein [Verrucomicrobiota bacterium]
MGVSGHFASEVILRDCEMFQCSSGFFMRGHDVLVERVFCHDNIVHNTSPHPFLVDVRRAVLRSSVFDASGWHASAGTMGIMLGDIHGLIIRNSHFRNQPDSGSHDEGGIDFENRGNGCLIDRCTFENNAGAAIEVLGLQTPQTTNIEIRDSKFIQNNVAKKLGPAEIFVWGRVKDPSICCSTGLVRGNGYVLLPGVEFFVNEAPKMTSWTLRENKAFASVAEIDRAMPLNRPPAVKAGADVHTNARVVTLAGAASDDGLPAGKKLLTTWEVLEGPGAVTFDDDHAPATNARFETEGDYVLRLVADDGELWTSDRVAVHVTKAGTKVLAAWEFNRNHDKEGWSEADLGTRVKRWANKDWPTESHPVKHVAGGFYTVAIEKSPAENNPAANSPAARLVSGDNLNVELSGREKLVLRMQNQTPATAMRVAFATRAETAWKEENRVEFAVTPNDHQVRTYTVDLSQAAGWKGTLKQLRIDLATGQPLTGTCRIDWVWVVREE